MDIGGAVFLAEAKVLVDVIEDSMGHAKCVENGVRKSIREIDQTRLAWSLCVARENAFLCFFPEPALDGGLGEGESGGECETDESFA